MTRGARAVGTGWLRRPNGAGRGCRKSSTLRLHTEMWNGACMAFGVGPLLTMGAVDALDAHGSDALKRTYLEKLVTGEWTGTMHLT